MLFKILALSLLLTQCVVLSQAEETTIEIDSPAASVEPAATAAETVAVADTDAAAEAPLDARDTRYKSSGSENNEKYNSNSNNKKERENDDSSKNYRIGKSNSNNNDKSDNNNNNKKYETKSSGAYKHKNLYKGTIDLGTTYSNSKETRLHRSRKDKWLKYNSWSRIDTHLNTVKKHVHTHTINNVYLPKKVVHIEKNHMLTVVNHKYPKVINVNITRWRKIIKPVVATEIVRNYDKQVKYDVAPTKYEKEEKKINLPTIWVPVKALGVVSDVKGRSPQPGSYEQAPIQKPYESLTYKTSLETRSTAPTQTLAERFKRAAVTANEFMQEFVAAADAKSATLPVVSKALVARDGADELLGQSPEYEKKNSGAEYNVQEEKKSNEYENESPKKEEYKNNKEEDDRSDKENKYEKNNSDNDYQAKPTSSGAYKSKNVWKGTIDLGTTYSESESSKASKSLSEKYKKEKFWKRIDTHLNTVKKHVHTHLTNYIEKPKEITHVEKNYLLTVVNHKYPKEINVQVNKYRKIVKPEAATEIVRNYDKKVDYVVAPTKYEKEEKTVKLPTVWEATKNFGIVSDTIGRKPQPSAYEKKKEEPVYEEKKKEEPVYEDKKGSSNTEYLLDRKAPFASVVERF